MNEETTHAGDSARLVTRGLLIILIVLGHNRFFHNNYYSLYMPLYTFHVSLFMLMPFLGPSDPRKVRELRKYTKRYMTPFYFFLLFYSVLYFSIASDDSATSWLGNLGAAAALANSYFVKAATGFEMLWFLPAFTLMVCLHAVLDASGTRARLLIGAGATIVHLTIGIIPEGLLKWVPFSAYISLYVFVVGMILREIVFRYGNFTKYKILASVSLFVAASYIQNVNKWPLILSEFTVFDFRSFPALFTTDIQALSGAYIMLAAGRAFKFSNVLARIGSRSLKIYLMHGLIGYVVFSAYSRAGLSINAGMDIFLTAATTLALSYLGSIAIERTVLDRFIFPSGLEGSRKKSSADPGR